MTLQEYNQEWENRLKASQAKYDEDLKAARAEKETLFEAAAVSLLSQGVGEETVSECLGLPIEEVIKLRKRS